MRQAATPERTTASLHCWHRKISFLSSLRISVAREVLRHKRASGKQYPQGFVFSDAQRFRLKLSVLTLCASWCLVSCTSHFTASPALQYDISFLNMVIDTFRSATKSPASDLPGVKNGSKALPSSRVNQVPRQRRNSLAEASRAVSAS